MSAGTPTLRERAKQIIEFLHRHDYLHGSLVLDEVEAALRSVQEAERARLIGIVRTARCEREFPEWTWQESEVADTMRGCILRAIESETGAPKP